MKIRTLYRSRTYDRVLTAALHKRRDHRPDDEHICTCGWITARPVCPMCNGIRVDERGAG